MHLIEHQHHQYVIGPGFLLIIAVIAGWTLFWKGLALWRAGRDNEPRWFVALLLINTFGVFEMLYIYVISKNIAERKALLTFTPKKKKEHN